jgi:hypothetical protein
MKRILLTSAMAFVAYLSQAQITLNLSNAPSTGIMIINNDANVPSPPFTFSKSGTSNTWTFTGIACDSINDDTVFVLNPSTLPTGSNFPGATHATYEAGDDGVSFLKVDATGAYTLGVAGDLFSNGSTVVLKPASPVLSIAFPFTYNNNNSSELKLTYKTTGTAIGQPSVDSVMLIQISRPVRDVIAAGNIVLPSGTFPALLERVVNHNTDSSMMKGTITGGNWILAPGSPKVTHDSTFYWYTTRSLIPTAHCIYKSGVITDVTFYKKTVSIPMGIATPEISKNISFYPNPASDIAHFDASLNINRAEIYNLQGQLVINAAITNNSMPLNDLSTGIYFVKCYNSSNEIYVGKVVKQ